MNTFKVWLIFSLGVAAGATVALVTAPQSGAKTRKQIKRKLDDTTDYLKDQLDDASGYVKDQASTLSDQAAKVYQSGRDAAAKTADQVSSSIQDATKNVKSAVS